MPSLFMWSSLHHIINRILRHLVKISELPPGFDADAPEICLRAVLVATFFCKRASDLRFTLALGGTRYLAGSISQ